MQYYLWDWETETKIRLFLNIVNLMRSCLSSSAYEQTKIWWRFLRLGFVPRAPRVLKTALPLVFQNLNMSGLLCILYVIEYHLPAYWIKIKSLIKRWWCPLGNDPGYMHKVCGIKASLAGHRNLCFTAWMNWWAPSQLLWQYSMCCYDGWTIPFNKIAALFGDLHIVLAKDSAVCMHFLQTLPNCSPPLDMGVHTI